MGVGGSGESAIYRAPSRRAGVGFAAALLLLALSVVGLAWVIVPSSVGSVVQQWLHPGSKLAFGEERIAHIPGEFERRSPLFAASWEMFKACTRVDGCDSAPALSMRDQAIKLVWPEIFDRLVIRDDWGEYEESARARDDFFDELAAKGKDTLRNKCVPKIIFELIYGGERYYRFKGFSCS